MTSDILLREFNSLPENLQIQVLEFISLLKKSKPTVSKSSGSPMPKSLKAGFGKYKIVMAADFDEPLEMFNEYMP